MSDDNGQDRTIVKKATFEEFEEFYKDNLDFENADLYEEFNENPKGTIRAWKLRVKKSLEDGALPQVAQGSMSNEEFVLKSMCRDLGVDYKALKAMGMSYAASLDYLQGQYIDQELKGKDKKNQRAGGILPTPVEYGDNYDYGISEYITKFDGVKCSKAIM